MSTQPSSKQTKVNFISDLLQSRKLDAAERERVFSLVAREINFMESKGDFILAEIEAIKAKISADQQEIVLPSEDADSSTSLPNLPIYIHPQNNAEFLKELNQDPILKSLTHNTDTNQLITINEALGIIHYDFEKHLKEIHLRYGALGRKYRNKLSKGLGEKTYQYIHGKNQWSEDKITMSWSHPDLLLWAQENPGKCPNSSPDVSNKIFKFTRIATKNGDQLQTMPELVLFFKKQLSIRSDNNLYNLIEGWNIPFREQALFNLEKLHSNVEFFTDVEKLHQAYRQFVQLCIECLPNHKPKIDLSVHIEKTGRRNKIVFSIWQTNAKCNRTKEDLLDRYGATFTNLINQQINGLCDWTIDADFGDEDYAHISIWPKSHEFHDIEKMEGLRYNLIFN
jgi:hypothetical protein